MSSFRAKAAHNRGLPCRVQSCLVGRASISPYCDRHAKAVERYGHPLGRAVHPKRDYGVERELVSAFLAKHSSHPGVASAHHWLRRWLDEANLGQEVPGRSELQRLHAHMVSPLAILTEAASLFLLSHWRPRVLPDDERLTFAIGVRVLSLAPRTKRAGRLRGKPRLYCKAIGKVDRREVGRRIRLNLAALLANIAAAITQEEGAQRAMEASLRQPFR